MENSEEKRASRRSLREDSQPLLISNPPTKSEVITLVQKTAVGLAVFGLFSFLVRLIVSFILGRSFS